MENQDKKFREFMKRQEMGHLLPEPNKYRAVIRHFTSKEPTVLEEFKTKKEFEEWYKSAGAAFENSAQGKIELEEVFE